MDDQPSLFDNGETLKTAGQREAARNAACWTELAFAAIGWLATHPRAFTVEDVVAIVGLPNPEATGMNANNAVGAVMSAAARSGLIHQTGQYVKAIRPKSHARVVAVWAGPDLGGDSEPADGLPPEDSPEADEAADHDEGDFTRWIFRKD